ncbi:MAG: TlyA family rRNA (cytidine-2-O)-methyltransferase [Bacilli bacterium]|nr:TlyA family rRNA (cytidine-2-O)-methyltransferase [Bacilli bacterium]
MTDKERLDVSLVEQGFYETREKAKAAVMAGLVRVNGEILDKPGTRIKPTDRLEVKGPLHPYVSRGGLKLEKAIREFQVPFAGQTVLDIGASTGGFTDCALQHGAAKVYAVDVGYGQLAWSLRQDPRVVVMERTNFRHLQPEKIAGDVGIAVMDVSFISIRLLLPVLLRTLIPLGHILSLVKPQFEAGKEHVGKHGIVRDPEVHRSVLIRVSQAALALGMQILGYTFSPITGGDGNIEFLMHLQTPNQGSGSAAVQTETLSQSLVEQIHQVVAAAHTTLLEAQG